jgi:hypothetical protein
MFQYDKKVPPPSGRKDGGLQLLVAFFPALQLIQ